MTSVNQPSSPNPEVYSAMKTVREEFGEITKLQTEEGKLGSKSVKQLKSGTSVFNRLFKRSTTESSEARIQTHSENIRKAVIRLMDRDPNAIDSLIHEIDEFGKAHPKMPLQEAKEKLSSFRILVLALNEFGSKSNNEMIPAMLKSLDSMKEVLSERTNAEHGAAVEHGIGVIKDHRGFHGTMEADAAQKFLRQIKYNPINEHHPAIIAYSPSSDAYIFHAWDGSKASSVTISREEMANIKNASNVNSLMHDNKILNDMHFIPNPTAVKKEKEIEEARMQRGIKAIETHPSYYGVMDRNTAKMILAKSKQDEPLKAGNPALLRYDPVFKEYLIDVWNPHTHSTETISIKPKEIEFLKNSQDLEALFNKRFGTPALGSGRLILNPASLQQEKEKYDRGVQIIKGFTGYHGFQLDQPLRDKIDPDHNATIGHSIVDKAYVICVRGDAGTIKFFPIMKQELSQIATPADFQAYVDRHNKNETLSTTGEKFIIRQFVPNITH